MTDAPFDIGAVKDDVASTIELDEWRAEITVFQKAKGPLTKRIALRDGKPVIDSSACGMAKGYARRVSIDSVHALADQINNFRSNEAYALGRLKDGLPDRVDVVVRAKLNGAADVIARTKEYLIFVDGEPGFALLDFDRKGMPDTVAPRIEESGGLWQALCEVLPALKAVAHVDRASTSTGLRNSETGEIFLGSGGRHIAVPVQDAADIPRFLSDLSDRCWLTRYGWGIVSGAGSFLERSLIDKSVGSPERLIFEGAAVVIPPLVQEARDAVAYDGELLDTRSSCPPLTNSEKQKLKKLKAAERERLAPQCRQAREAWSKAHVERLVAGGMSEEAARAQVERWLVTQELSGAFLLIFDDPEIGATTVEQVLASPDKYVGKTLADPFEGPDYGIGKAKVLRRRDGALIVHSYAHGRIIYKLLKAKDAGVVLPRGFSLSDRGWWHQEPWEVGDAEPKPKVWFAGPFSIEAQTSDDNNDNHGLLLKWKDHNDEPHSWAMPREMVHSEGNAIAAELEKSGLSCGTFSAQHNYLKQLLGAVRVKRRMRCVDRSGWYGAVVMMPDARTFGAAADSIVLQTGHVVAGGRYAARGTLDEWRDNVARYAVGNDLFTVAISGAYVPPLLDILGEPSRIGHFRGASQSGKTTLVRGAVSVYGPAEDRYMRSWRATANGLEAAAAETNDLLMTLDELSQADAREVGQVVYMIGNSTGKQRANRSGGARQQLFWRTFAWSTGEISLKAKLSEAGRRTTAGQDVRMVDISADAGNGMGVWQKLYDFKSGAALTDHLRTATCAYCGTAGPAFLDQLARDRADDPAALAETLRNMRQKFLDEHLPEGADGQVISICKLFALIAAAGELATEYGITKWPEDEALRAAGVCFERWLADRGGTGAGEDMRAVVQVRGFIAMHRSSRFETIGNSEPIDNYSDQKPEKIINCAGWKQMVNGEWQFLITTDCWNDEVCQHLNPSHAAKAVYEAGFLKEGETLPSGKRRWTVKPRIGAYGTVRVYLVYGSILEGDDNGE